MKLSIITINYNNASGLKRTLHSLPFGNFEFESIVIDGGSTDDSIKVLEEFQEKGLHIVSEPDKGVYDAMNKGLTIATGDYVNFMNSGDTFVSGSLDIILPKLNEEKIYFGNRLTGNLKKVQQWPTQLNFSDFVLGGGIGHQTQFIPRIFFQKFGGYDDGEKIISDWKWNLLAAARWGCQFEHLGAVVCHYEGGGMSSFGSSEHDSAVLRQKKFLAEEFSLFLPELEELTELRIRAQKQNASRIYRLAKMFFNLKNGNTRN